MEREKEGNNIHTKKHKEDKFYEDGHDEGYDDGHDEGYDDGHDGAYDGAYEDGHDDGLDNGHDGAYDDGLDNGHDDDMVKGERNIFEKVKLEINLFNYYFNYQKNVFSHLNHSENKFTCIDDYMNNTDIMVKQKKHISVLYNIDIFIKNKKNIIIGGCSNIGKTLSVDYFLKKVIAKDKFFTVEFFFSNSTKSKHVRNHIESKLTKRRNNYYGTPNNRICIFYIDDINIETNIGGVKNSHSLSCHEFLRMLFNYKYFIDDNLNYKYIEDITCIGTMNNSYST
ncbi:hypothetical protein PFTANZ_05983, partial [Plasmodium falciparum Tanzania (2000708)]